MEKEVIAVDLGGTRLRVALIKGTKIIKIINKPTPKTKKKIFQDLFKYISDLITKNVQGIAISSAGAIENGIIKESPNLPLKNTNIKKIISKKFQKKVFVENDANCVAIAEAKLGIKKNNFIILTLGTGIGGGIIINNKLHRGKGMGGELGHLIINKEKNLEYWASSKAIKRLTKKELKKELSIIQLFENKSIKADKIKDEIAFYLGQGIATLINIFDPEVVILSGGMKLGGKSFLNKIKKYTKKYLFLPRNLNIKWTKFKDPGIIGASIMFFDRK